MSQPESPNVPAAGPGNFDRADEYGIVMQDAAWLSERRQTSHNVFIGLNTLALTGMGYVVTTNRISTWWAFALVATIASIMIPFNVIWQLSLRGYKRGLDSRYAYLRDLETTFPQLMETPAGVFTKFKREEIERYSNSRQELRVAWYFMLLGPSIAAAVGLLTWLVTNAVIPAPH